MEDIYKQLGQIKLVPVVKISEPEKALFLAKALRRGGLPCAEITFRAKDAELSIKKITMAYPDMLIGAGTVLTVKQVDEAVQAGAKFIVSPGFNPEVVEYCVNNGIVIIPGCSNPSDIERAISFGLPVVKFFPAENLGGLSMIKALSAPYSQILFMPTGGIHMENLCEYLRCKKVIACGGSWMVKEEMIQNNEFDKITELCAKAVKCIKRMEENTGIPEKSYSLKNSASGKKYDLVSLGELLLRLSPAENERISDGRVFLKYPGGAELNVASGLSLLGLKSGMISRLPENSLADYMRARVREKGVSDEYIIRDQSPGARLGIYYCEPALSPRKPSVVYDRKHTSMTGFRSEEVPDSAINQAKLFFTSSITLAVAGFNYGEVLQVIERFRTAGAAIAFDVNYRASLWTEEQARQVIQKVLPLTDILFVSEESSRRMFGKSGSLESIMKSYCDGYVR